MSLRLITGMLVLSLLGPPAVSSAAVVRISPQTAPDCQEEFEKVANTLQPGDELILRGGTYSQACRRAITVNGTAAAPIVIRAATGERPIITRPADNIDTHKPHRQGGSLGRSSACTRPAMRCGFSLGARAVRVVLDIAYGDCRACKTCDARIAFPPGPLVDAAGVRPPWLSLGSP